MGKRARFAIVARASLRLTGGVLARWLAFLVFAGAAVGLRADRAAEIARIHVEAVGGQQRLAALTALRMTGVVTSATTTATVSIIAARPARLRAETRFGGRTIVQAWDGTAPPWQFDSAALAPGITMLPAGAAERFLADAEFDDPLVAAFLHGAPVEFAGEVEVGGRKLLRLLVPRKLTENIFLLLDPQTYFILLRVQRLTRAGAQVELVTRYEEYRPVNGVLIAHVVTLFEDGRQTQRARFESIEALAAVDEELFRMPREAGKPGGP